jgi:hypothetical protein
MQTVQRVKLHKESFRVFTERVSELCVTLSDLLNLFVDRGDRGAASAHGRPRAVLEEPPQVRSICVACDVGFPPLAPPLVASAVAAGP